MADLACLIDTSVFIQYLRAPDKTKSLLDRLDPPPGSAMSTVTLMELEFGTLTTDHRKFLNALLSRYAVVSFDPRAAVVAGDIHRRLRRTNRQIGIPDLMVAAVAVANKMPLATLNTSHFQRVPGLQLVDARQ